MKLYLAAMYTSNFGYESNQFIACDERERWARVNVRHVLESYHYIKGQRFVNAIKKDGVQVFLDSGAFSAYTSKKEIDIDAYINYIKENEEIIVKEDGQLCASVLDGIGDPLKTYQNQAYMESRGVRPLPCFHYGEDERYLEWYLKHYDYITLGGMVPISTTQLVHWLDRIWNDYIVDGAGYPRVKVHGFGLTQQMLMERYPWWSVDSSSWQQIGSNGGIVIPGHKVTAISSNSPKAKEFNQHLDTLTDPVREALENLIRSQGFNVDRLRQYYYSRWCYNCWAYTKINDELLNSRPPTFKREQMELF